MRQGCLINKFGFLWGLGYGVCYSKRCEEEKSDNVVEEGEKREDKRGEKKAGEKKRKKMERENPRSRQ